MSLSRGEAGRQHLAKAHVPDNSLNNFAEAHQNVRRLYVAVQNTHTMQIGQPAEDILANKSPVFVGEILRTSR